MTTLLAVLVALRPGAADAICIAPPAFIYPEGGALPSWPSLYAFVFKGYRSDGTLVAQDPRGRVPMTWHLLSDGPFHDVYRVDLRSLFPGELRLFWFAGFSIRQTASYTVEWGPRPDATTPAQILGQSVTIVDGCPAEDTRDLLVSVDAPAYRVVFAHSREDWLAGRTESTIVPSDPRRRQGPDSRNPRGLGVARLGWVGCLGPSFSWERGAVYLSLSALMADGSETPLPQQPTLVEPPGTNTRG